MDNPVKVINDIIKNESLILGPVAALMVAKEMPQFKIALNGEVVSVKGDLKAVTLSLVNKYVELAGLIVRTPVEHYL